MSTEAGKAITSNSVQKDSESLTFTRDIIWMGLSQIFVSLLGIFTLPALTKSFTSETYGTWVQVSTTVGLVSPLLALPFGSAVVRFLAAENDRAIRRRTISTMLTAILIAASLVLFVTYMFPHQFSKFLFANPSYVNFVYLTVLWTVFNALSAFFIAYLRSRRKIKRISLIQASLAFSKVVAVIALTTAGFELVWIVAGIVIIELIFLSGIFYMLVRMEGFLVPGFYRIKDFLAFSLPQTPSSILFLIISASDRYFITHFINLAQTGIYYSSLALGALVALFYTPISFVLFPAVTRAWDQNRLPVVKDYFEYSTRLFLTLAVPAAAGLAILSQSLLKILATAEYLVGWDLVLLISTGTIFLGIYQINLFIIYLKKQTIWLPVVTLAALISTISLCVILLPRIGITGAAIANMTSYFLLAAIVTVWARRTIQYQFDFIYLFKVVAASLLMAVGLYFFKADNVFTVGAAIITGVIIFAIALWFLRALNDRDKQLIKQLFGGMLSGYFKKRS